MVNYDPEGAAETVEQGMAPAGAGTATTVYDAMEPGRQASAPVTAALEGTRAAVGTGATAVGGAWEVVTSFLSAVPAMLLVFPSTKVPIPIPLPLQFKPEELSWTKKNHWIKKNGSLKNASDAVYGGGHPEELDLDLFFDETDTQLDVRVHTTPLRMLASRLPLFDKPPMVMFVWGTTISKMSYVEKVDVTYTFFRPDGTPLRAKVKLQLVEWYDKLLSLAQNPTTRSEARKTWVVTEGETLDWIAYREYNDPAHWRHIAQVNDLDNPTDLRSGQILKLTPLP